MPSRAQDHESARSALPQPRQRGRLHDLALALASCLLTLLALEGVFRVLRLTRGPDSGTDPKAYMEHDPLLGWRKRPGARVEFRRREYTVDVSINSLGLRDPERGYQAAAGAWRVLALGDSYVEAYGVPLAATVSQVLERRLREQGCAADVVNGGTTGYSTDQELLFFRSEGLHYAPRIVVLFFYYNDVLANDRREGSVPKPMFVLRGGRLELSGTPVPRPRPAPSPAADDARESGSASALVGFLKERLWFGAPALFNRLGRLGLWPPNRPVGARLELRVYQRREIPEIEGAWQKTDALVRQMGQEVADSGARLLLAYIPSAMEVDDRSWRISQEKNEMRTPDWERGLPLRRVRDIAARAGVAFLDLSQPLREVDHGLLGGPYYPQDGHWNALGHRTAAAAVARELDRRGWLAGCSR